MQLSTLKKLLKPLLSVPCDKKGLLYILVEECNCKFILLVNSNTYKYNISTTVASISISTADTFSACINFRKFKAIISKLKSPTIELAITPTLLTINGLPLNLEPLTSTIAIADLQEAFTLSYSDKLQLSFNVNKIKQALDNTRYCTSLDATRNSLQSVWLMLDEDYCNIGAVATDGHKCSYSSRYSISDLNLLAPTAIKKGTGIPYNICDLISKCAYSAEDVLLVNLSKDSFKSTEDTIILTLGTTQIKFTAVFSYPNWLACLPNLQDANTASFTVILAELINKLESYKPFVHPKTKFILLELDKINSQISFKLTSTNEIVGNLPATFTNPSNTVIRLGLNLDYLLEHLYKMHTATGEKPTTEVTIFYNTEISAVTFSYVDSYGKFNYKLQMPLRILEDKEGGK